LVVFATIIGLTTLIDIDIDIDVNILFEPEFNHRLLLSLMLWLVTIGCL